jgi:hypothetical protein
MRYGSGGKKMRPATCSGLSVGNETILQPAASFQDLLKPCRTRATAFQEVLKSSCTPATAFQAAMNNNKRRPKKYFFSFCENTFPNPFFPNGYHPSFAKPCFSGSKNRVFPGCWYQK